jgi:uncharacterized protein YjiS (DUF1127 family)
MTAITQTSAIPLAPFARGLAAFVGIVADRVRRIARAAKHRHDAAILAGLDDRMLADIGLTRGDLRDAFARPLWQDPTAVLVDRVGERRVRRRGIGFSPAGLMTSPSTVPSPSIVPSSGAGASRSAARTLF